jgi:hypothetical protein
MTPLKAKQKANGYRLQGWWDRRQLRSVHEKLDEQERCMWLLVIVVVILSVLVIIK